MRSKNQILAVLTLSLGIPAALQAQGTGTVTKSQNAAPQNRVHTLLNNAAQNLSTKLKSLDSLYEANSETPAEARVHDGGTLHLDGYDFTVSGALGALLNVVNAITPKLIVEGEEQAIPLYTALDLTNCTLLTEDGADFELFKSIAQQKLHTLSLEGSAITQAQLRLLVSTLGQNEYNSEIATVNATIAVEPDVKGQGFRELLEILRGLRTTLIARLTLSENDVADFVTEEHIPHLVELFAGRANALSNMNIAGGETLDHLYENQTYIVVKFKNEHWYISNIEMHEQPSILRARIVTPEAQAGVAPAPQEAENVELLTQQFGQIQINQTEETQTAVSAELNNPAVENDLVDAALQSALVTRTARRVNLF
jgi:hypothetical protein